MKKTNLLLLGFLFGFLFLTTSCDKEDEPVINNESEVLADYLTTYSTNDPAMISSTDLNTLVITNDTKTYVIDIRSAADFAAGHITGAVNVTLTNLLTYYEINNLSTKTTVALACYSGQTANYGASLLRMLGYTNVKALKFGMSSWNPATNKWTANTNNQFSALMETAAGTKNTAGELPVINTGKTTGAEILRARVEALLAVADPFADAKITNQATYDNRAANYTVNYWKPSHYNFKHLPGSVQYTQKTTMSITQELKTLPANKTIVIYCYTGQTSAFLVAYLKVLGYDAKSLLYGANGMMYDDMLTYNTTAASDDKMSVFVEAAVVMEYPLVTN